MDSSGFLRPNVPVLVVSNSPEHEPNVMAAAWWMVGGYRPFRYLLAVAQHTHTHDLIESNPEFVMAVPTTDMIDALTVAGKLSGRDIDKLDHLDLETVPGKGVDVPLLVDAVGNVELEVMESFEYADTTYYFGDVQHAFVTPGAMNGRVLSGDSNVLANLGSDWADGDDDMKHRYYIDFDDSDIESHPGSSVLEDLPADLAAQLRD